MAARSDGCTHVRARQPLFGGRGAFGNGNAFQSGRYLYPGDQPAAGSVTLQTYGFGGGTNAAGTAIPSGGFDPFVGLFSGTGSPAVFINGDSDVTTNYTPGCPPAGLVTIGSVPGQCGDVNLQFTGLTPGTYTALLTDGENIPNALFEPPGGLLGDGFTDLSGGVFQTCVDANDCNNDTANWALDITEPGGSAPSVPEPGAFGLAGLGLLLAAGLAVRKKPVTHIRTWK